MKRFTAFESGIVTFGASLNVFIGYFVSVLKLPLYIDSIGTILIAVLCGWKLGTLAGLLAILVLTLTVSPTIIAYSGTVVVISSLSSYLAKHGFLKNLRMTIFGGFLIGIAASLVSAPVTIFLYKGVSLAGSDWITATFRNVFGFPLWQSVFMGGLMIDPFDKIVTSIICLTLARALPGRMRDRMASNSYRSEHKLQIDPSQTVHE